jgi:hypothetical protein
MFKMYFSPTQPWRAKTRLAQWHGDSEGPMIADVQNAL